MLVAAVDHLAPMVVIEVGLAEVFGQFRSVFSSIRFLH